MVPTPHVSLILVVKDGLPYLPEAVRSVAAQTYRDFEVVVQDGASSDGTLDYLRSVRGLPALEIESAPDAGIGQAYNRALKRCRGEIIGSIDADNLLEPEALATIVAKFAQEPAVAAIYGAVRMLDAQGAVEGNWIPPVFGWLGLLQCDVVPPFGQSFFSRRVCGDALRFDESLKTCADFDLWLRVSHLPILQINDFIGRVRVSPKSMSCRVETYDQFCRDKLSALRRYLEGFELPRVTEPLFRLAAAGIYSWAAESVQRLQGPTPQFSRYLVLAAELQPASDGFRRLLPLPALPSTAEDLALESQASPLLDVGPASVPKLERCIYGQAGPRVLALEGRGLVFTPTTGEDHFATSFQPIKFPAGAGSGWAFLRVRFPEHPCPERMMVCVQDQDYSYLAKTQKSEQTLRVCIPPCTTALRLSFTAPSGGASLFPEQAQLSVTYAETVSSSITGKAAEKPAAATADPTADSICLAQRARLGRMLPQPGPISAAELHRTNLALTKLLDAADPVAYLRKNRPALPPAVQPLLLVILAAAWAEGDLGLSAALENVHRALVEKPAPVEPAVLAKSL